MLGWLLAGRILRPLRKITTATRSSPKTTWPAASRTRSRQRAQRPRRHHRRTARPAAGRLRRPAAVRRQRLPRAAHPAHPRTRPARGGPRRPAATAATLRSTCEDVLVTGEEQERLIEALLTLARSQRGLDHRDCLDLAAITRQTLAAREAESTARGLAVTTSVGPVAPVAGDPRLLERLTANLIDNAIRYNIPGGQIRIRVTTSGGQPTLRISNTGPAISADQIPQLLQPFQRQPATRSADQDGLGLGLAIVAAIAKAHHATLTTSPARTAVSTSPSHSPRPAAPPQPGKQRSPQHDKRSLQVHVRRANEQFRAIKCATNSPRRAAVYPGVHRGRPAVPSCSRRPVVRRRDIREGRRPVDLLVPSDRPARPGHRRAAVRSGATWPRPGGSSSGRCARARSLPRSLPTGPPPIRESSTS